MKEYQQIIKDCISTYDIIIPTSEPEIKIIASLFENDNSNPFLILPSKIVNMFLDKYATFKYLDSKNFDPPMTKLLLEASKEDLPIYLKPKFGAGGKGNRVLSNEHDLLSAKSTQTVVFFCLCGVDRPASIQPFSNFEPPLPLFQPLDFRRTTPAAGSIG